MKKDRIFVIVIGVLLANLALWTAGIISSIVDEPDNITLWSYLIADCVAIYGALWLFRSYRKGRKRVRELERRQEEQEMEQRERVIEEPGDNHG